MRDKKEDHRRRLRLMRLEKWGEAKSCRSTKGHRVRADIDLDHNRKPPEREIMPLVSIPK